MVKTITGEDLLQARVEIAEEQRQARHQQNNLIQNALHEVDDLRTSSLLSNQSILVMQEWIKKIDKSVEDWFDKISKKLESVNEKFITKDEFSFYKKIIVWTIMATISLFLWALFKLLIK